MMAHCVSEGMGTVALSREASAWLHDYSSLLISIGNSRSSSNITNTSNKRSNNTNNSNDNNNNRKGGQRLTAARGCMWMRACMEVLCANK